MKIALILFLFPLLIFAQKKEVFKLKFPLKDYTRTTKSLEVIDVRKNKEIKDIFYRGNTYSFSFPTNNLSKDIENWFKENNKKRDKATNEIVMLVEDLNIFNENRNNQIFCVLDMKVSTFLKKDQNYYFLKRYDNVISLNSKEEAGIPNTFAENTQKVLQNLMFETYRANPLEIAIPEKDLNNYDEILKSNYAAFSKNDLKDGVYLDSKSFFTQTPLENYKLIKNSKDEVLKATNAEEDKIPRRKIYIYVENGKAFKNTQAGFLQLQKDENGFYVIANKYILFPEEINTSSAFFLFGAIGGIGASVQFYIKYKKALEGEKYKIYIDYLNGEYSFVK